MVETGTILQNRYLIESQIGEGGMGAVYRAVDKRFGSRVAIKQTFYKENDLGEAFEREARLLNALHHPILPHVSDYFTEGDGYFLVMEFIEGDDLSEILKREGSFPPETVLRWLDELLDCLDYLHSQQPPIIHRDIKPQNLKITGRGDVVLLDFGLAKLSDSGDQLSRVKSVFGYSRVYSPLEQIEGTGTDARSDIFALGATAFHLLTGKFPLDVLARAAAIVAGKPDPLQLASEIDPKIPLAVAQILQTALALNPERRFVSASAMRKALKYAVETGDAKNVAALANPAPASVETKIFPALASFAANQNSSEGSPESPIQLKIPVAKAQQQAGTPTQSAVATNTAVQPKTAKNSFLKIAALAAVLIGGAFTVWYVASDVQSSNQTNQNSVSSETTPVTKSETPAPAVVSFSPVPPASPAATPEKEKTAQSKPTVEPKKPAAENRQSPDNAPAPETVQSTETPRPQIRHTQTRSTPTPRRPTANAPPRQTEQPAVSNIERVITGGDAEREQRREQRRERRELSEEEKEEIRRRRIEEILRQNRQPVPPQ